jgi:hypothetical protein
VVPWATKMLATYQTRERRFGMTNILVWWARGIKQTRPWKHLEYKFTFEVEWCSLNFILHFVLNDVTLLNS